MEPKISTARSSNKLLFFSLILIVLAGALVFVMLQRNRGTKKVEIYSNLIPTEVPKATGPELRLSPVSANSTISLGQPITVKLMASSFEQDIVGYDAVVTYDPAFVEFRSATSSHADFKIVEKDQNGTLYITGVKDFAKQKKTVFDRTEIATITFIAARAGSATFDLAYAAGQTDESNLMNTDTQDVLEYVAGTTIKIE